MAHCLAGDPLTAEEIKGKRGAALGRYVANPNAFQVGLVEAPLKLETLHCCLLGACPYANVCASVHARHRTLNHLHPGSDWDNYQCCQGYVPECCCFKAGACFEADCPRAAACCEAFCCPGLAISATRYLLMDQYALQPDPCDNRLIRFNNCVQVASCLCHVAAVVAGDRSLRELAQLLDCVAEVVFWSTAGCMIAQITHELNFRDGTGASRGGAIGDSYSPLAPEDVASLQAPPSLQTPIEGRF